jgi:hypothetical protein
MNNCYQTLQEEQRKSDLKHYYELSTKSHSWSNGIPRAINFYYDYQKMSLIQKLILAFKTKKAK